MPYQLVNGHNRHRKIISARPVVVWKLTITGAPVSTPRQLPPLRPPRLGLLWRTATSPATLCGARPPPVCGEGWMITAQILLAICWGNPCNSMEEWIPECDDDLYMYAGFEGRLGAVFFQVRWCLWCVRCVGKSPGKPPGTNMHANIVVLTASKK